jgi:hypothetical protein
MMAMTTPADMPQQGPIRRFLFGSTATGCSGTTARGGFLGTGSGCSGSFNFSLPATTVTGCSGSVAARFNVATGCSGSTQTTFNFASDPTGTPALMGSTVGLGQRRVMLRLEAAHAINVQERRGLMTAEEAAAAHEVMRDPDKRAAFVAKLDRLATRSNLVGATGDHPFLDWFVQNWGSILQMFKDIIALFGRLGIPVPAELYAFALSWA